jgi:hypothetical protein
MSSPGSGHPRSGAVPETPASAFLQVRDKVLRVPGRTSHRTPGTPRRSEGPPSRKPDSDRPGRPHPDDTAWPDPGRPSPVAPETIPWRDDGHHR